ncbi:MAG: hypothetical protein CMJ58_11500 [Planctomycetaceae bacterium]|nr:hypothetical protein [Planctomycetaceae bacterium]
MISRHGSQSLRRPGEAPFGTIGASAGLEPADRSADVANRTCRETDSRFTCNSRAMRRADQPRSWSVRIDCTVAILSRFAIGTSFRGGRRRKVHDGYSSLLKLAGFNAPIGGWF